MYDCCPDCLYEVWATAWIAPWACPTIWLGGRLSLPARGKENRLANFLLVHDAWQGKWVWSAVSAAVPAAAA